MARLFAAEGAAVFLSARSEHELSSTTAEITKSGGRAAFAVGDVSREEDCGRIVAACRKTFGGIHILVNNAGHYGPVAAVEDYPVGDFDAVLAVHLRGAFLLSRAKAAFAWGSAYAAAKAGLLGLTRVTAAEAARKGVRVNAICPGPVAETRMSKELGEVLAKKLGQSPEEQLAQFVKGLLQGRPQTADEIARAALFLCSEQSSAITGQALNVDGGMAFY